MRKVVRFLRRYAYGAYCFSLGIVTRIPSQHIRRYILKLYGMKFGIESVIYGGAEIRSPHRIVLKKSVSVGSGAVLDGRGGLEIGDCVNISSEVMLWTMQHDYRCEDFRAVAKKIVIEEYVWLGPRVIVLPGVTIAKGCVIAAGAVVTRATEAFGVYAGVPAKRIGERPKTFRYTPGRDYIPII